MSTTVHTHTPPTDTTHSASAERAGWRASGRRIWGRRAPWRSAFTVLAVVGAGLLIGSAGIHLRLWSEGYRNIPTIGPLFLLQSISGFALAVVLVLLRRPLVALAGAAFLASTIGGLVLSAWIGLFGFHDGYGAPFAGSSLLTEGLGVAVLAMAALVGRRQPAGRPAPTT